MLTFACGMFRPKRLATLPMGKRRCATFKIRKITVKFSRPRKKSQQIRTATMKVFFNVKDGPGSQGIGVSSSQNVDMLGNASGHICT